jgi:flagellar biosynthesis/type III secretory pathway M-ring protein FliF/YscJ
MVQPSALNVIIIGLSMVVFAFFWRMIAAKLSERGSAVGDAMAVIL